MFPGGDIMLARLIAAGFVALIAVTPALAQTSQQAEKPETNCPTASASSPTGQTTGSTGNSMAMEKSAILPSASGHAHSAAPTVQQDGKPMQARPDCPPDQARQK
jgi:hypothetical protein